jgi:hypothetical protein
MDLFFDDMAFIFLRVPSFDPSSTIIISFLVLPRLTASISFIILSIVAISL